jgi:hypothetical protein
MEVAVSIRRTVVIYNNVDSFHVDTPTEDIRSDEDTLLECLESSVAFDTINQSRHEHNNFMTASSSATYRSSWAKPE